MVISVSRKKNKLSKKKEANEKHGYLLYAFARSLFRIPVAIFVLAFIYIWSSSTAVISSNVLHLCVSSRKLNNLYCLSAGTQPGLHIPISMINQTSSPAMPDVTEFGISNNSILSPDVNVRNETLGDALRTIQDQLQIQRSWRSSNSNSPQTTCEGRGIFVYDLPSKFNQDLLSNCREMIPWEDFCKFMSNGALGQAVEDLGSAWYHTHQYSLEPIFHSRILNHPCRVHNQNEAILFYVPYYGGLDILRWHFKNVTNDAKDSLGLELVKWLESQQSWYNNMGKDHVLVLGKITWDFRRREIDSWGTRLLELDEMQNPIKLLIERHPWELNDVGIPHPTYFHPKTENDVVSWQLKIIKSKRETLVSFAGADRPNSSDSIRSILINQCNSHRNCKFLNCTLGKCDDPKSIIDLFSSSEFCLQPPGDSPTRKSVFDSLISGCIPVLFDPFTVYYQYPWHFPEEKGKYSVLLEKEDVRNKGISVVDELAKISSGERENIRRFIVFDLLPGLIYGDVDSKFNKFQDSFTISVNNLLRRVSRLNQE